MTPRSLDARRPSGARSTSYAPTPAVGTPDEIVDRLGPFLQGGVQRVYLQVLDMSDLEHIEFVAETVVPQLR